MSFLYNVRSNPPTAPLLLYLPPSPAVPVEELEDQESLDTEAETQAQNTLQLQERVLASLNPPPEYLLRQNYPIAVIRYRWSPGKALAESDVAYASQDQDQMAPPSNLWPRPLHDVTFAYDWIKKHLSPPLSASTRAVNGRRRFLRRDFYVYGSYLGASLATSLALTETHPQHRVAIRGVAAYNGIYNWTAFVGMTTDSIPVADDAEVVQKATPGIQDLARLFRKPPDLFDAFASPCLFFRTTGHLIAPLDLDRDTSRRLLEENEARLEEDEEREDRKTDLAFGTRTFGMDMLGTSRKVYLGFPPVQSTLCIPSALFLHTTVPPDADPKPPRARKQGTKPSVRPRKIPESSNGHNSFAIQADEMMSLMRRGIDKVEIKRLKDRPPVFMSEYNDHRIVEPDLTIQSSESEQRVRIASVDAPMDDSLELGKDGQEKLLDWLNEHMLNSDE
ncbi:hypothetical protein SBRCBS47491_006138 [Sporothrix bragantina]|uniref:Alpha/beta hydrolase fold-3 domain-containing protein n=1 Tax=Sporothrix bragantina TaxID=671064 RepID=A0ABP0C2E2_9PEZI